MSMKALVIGVLSIGIASITWAQQVVGDSELLRAIRNGDGIRVTELLQRGASPNARDDSGATALMHAAAFAPADIMQLLLNHGADAKMADRAGATALMWATHDATKVRLLIDLGADVNAARPDGMTALISAAVRGKADVMRILLAAGADARRGAVMAPWPMGLTAIALTTSDATLREFVDRSELTADKLSQWTPPPLTNWMLTSVFSWRPQPAASRAASLRTLLDAGANPNETVAQLTLSVPALSRLIRLDDLDATRLLLERGANPNSAGSRGLTPLMMAASSEYGAPTVRMLLAKGARIDAQDDSGQTALDWALRLGDTESSRILRKAGAKEAARPVPMPVPISTPRVARAAVEVGIERLQPAGPLFRQKAGCISCHHQSLPAIAVSMAAAKRARIDRLLASHPAEATLEVWARSREQMLLGNCAVFGFLGNVTYGLFDLAEEGIAPNPVTDAVASCLRGLQNPNGSWEGADMRPPLLGKDPIVYTALALRGLKTYAAPGQREDTAARTSRALDFIRRTRPDDTQDDAFKLIGLVWGSATPGEISTQAQRLRLQQREDGGWSQLSTMRSDAYATGQALYALRMSGMDATHPTYRRGVEYLLRTQLEDGSWYVRSRTIGFQPYVETGFPHGPDQFISAAATSWAVIALCHAL